MPNLPTASERWFDQYLSDHGYTVTPEPDLGIPTLPDRLIERDGTAAICEVKEFRSDALRRRWPEGGSQVSTFSSAEWLASVRRAIREAARQLQPLAGDRRPLVIVLANPHGVAVDLDGRKLMEAMQGQLTIQIPMGAEAGQLTEEPRFVLGDDGRLAGDQAPWVGAVVGLHRGEQDWARSWIEQWKAEHWPDGPPADRTEFYADVTARAEGLEEAMEREDVPTGSYLRLDVVEAISDTAVQLPRTIFNGERDNRWVVNREASTWDLAG